ncbi:MAG: YckD family protein [Eubacteriales bacterium]
MKKKVLIALTVVLVLAFAVPALGALTGFTDVQKQQILDLHKQTVELRKQMVDKYVEAGQLTADEGKAAKDRIDQAEKYRQDNNILPGQGLGRGNCGGFGGGCGGPGLGGQGFGRANWTDAGVRGFGSRGVFNGPAI